MNERARLLLVALGLLVAVAAAVLLAHCVPTEPAGGVL